MPSYSYRCINCGHVHDQYHKIASKPEPCPKCRDDRYLEKIPQEISVSKKIETKQNVGEVVKSTIEEEKSALEEEKKRLRERNLWK